MTAVAIIDAMIMASAKLQVVARNSCVIAIPVGLVPTAAWYSLSTIGLFIG